MRTAYRVRMHQSYVTFKMNIHQLDCVGHVDATLLQIEKGLTV